MKILFFLTFLCMANRVLLAQDFSSEAGYFKAKVEEGYEVVIKLEEDGKIRLISPAHWNDLHIGRLTKDEGKINISMRQREITIPSQKNLAERMDVDLNQSQVSYIGTIGDENFKLNFHSLFGFNSLKFQVMAQDQVALIEENTRAIKLLLQSKVWQPYRESAYVAATDELIRTMDAPGIGSIAGMGCAFNLENVDPIDQQRLEDGERLPSCLKMEFTDNEVLINGGEFKTWYRIDGYQKRIRIGNVSLKGKDVPLVYPPYSSGQMGKSYLVDLEKSKQDEIIFVDGHVEHQNGGEGLMPGTNLP